MEIKSRYDEIFIKLFWKLTFYIRDCCMYIYVLYEYACRSVAALYSRYSVHTTNTYTFTSKKLQRIPILFFLLPFWGFLPFSRYNFFPNHTTAVERTFPGDWRCREAWFCEWSSFLMLLFFFSFSWQRKGENVKIVKTYGVKIEPVNTSV